MEQSVPQLQTEKVEQPVPQIAEEKTRQFFSRIPQWLKSPPFFPSLIYSSDLLHFTEILKVPD